MPTYAPTATTTAHNNGDPLGTTTRTTATATTKPPSATCSRASSDSTMRHKGGNRRGLSTQSGRSSLSSTGSSDETTGSRSAFLNSNADYEHLRNTTLMFFLDRLYMASKDGKEARSLHDLSCLFGTREFTKEMRQIVGASKNGLKKFLQGYPSLFSIDGDKVYLTQLKQDSVAPLRDYNKEAVEYFTQKLLQFGTSLVPIKNLFGYRSQASQEVRHVSGKNTKEFKQFLSAHDDVFEILTDEHVVLKSALQELESQGQTYTSLQQTHTKSNEETVIDPYLNKQFSHLIEDCMKKMQSTTAKPEVPNPTTTTTTTSTTTNECHKVTIEYLHERILKDCNNQLFLKMVKTIEDLKVFLRMHPKIFKRFRCDQDQRDYVSLLTDEERREMEVSSYPSMLLTRQHSTLRRTETNESNLSDNSSINGGSCGQPMSLPPQFISEKQQPQKEADKQQRQLNNIDQPISSIDEQQKSTGRNNLNESNRVKPSATKPISSSSSLNNNNNNINNNNQQAVPNGRSSLRATAPPFVPSTHHQTIKREQPPPQASKLNHQQQTQSAARGFAPIQRSVSNLGPVSLAGHHRGPVIDPRTALRSYLIKASAVNTSSGLYSPSKLSNGAQHCLPQPIPLSRQTSNLISGDDLRTRTVNIVREASNIVTRIMTTADAVAFDCKGYNLGFDGQITLIQFAFLPKMTTTPASGFWDGKENDNNNISIKQKPEVCIFDLITNPELAYCLKPLLESEQVVKIVHDVRNKSNALFSQFGIMLNHVFDTQVANLVIQQQETGKPAYKSRYISMSKLCEIYGDEPLAKYRNLIKSKTRHSQGQQNNNNANSISTTTSNNSSSGKIKDVNYWKTRPLTDAMVYESTMDVYCLVGGVYQNLKAKIIPEYKPLFEQLNLEGVLARIKPDEIRNVKKERKIDLEVIDLKLKLYSDTTSSIVLSNREIRLLRHIDLSEEVRQKIQQCKKVAKKLERLDMKAALLQQSITSPVSSDADQSMEPNNSVQTNGSGASSCSHKSASINDSKAPISLTTTTTTDLQAQPEVDPNREATTDGLFNAQGELDETKMGNLMNSSMFDELKDRMIESSSLLESLANDVEEDEVAAAGGSGEHSLHKHSGSHDDCRCLCHKAGSIGGGSHEGEEASLKLSLSSSKASHISIDHEDASVESKSAVDMAIQCDLLS